MHKSTFCCFLLAVCLLLSACGSMEAGEDESGPDYSQLSMAEPAAEPLTSQYETEAFARYLRNGLRLHSQEAGLPRELVMTAERSGPSQGASTPNYSQTNVHVEGVDEADRLKYDGEHLFVAPSGGYFYPQGDDQAPAAIRILQTYPERAEALAIAEIEADGKRLPAKNLYLHSEDQESTQRLVTLGPAESPEWHETPGGIARLAYLRGPTGVRVETHDVSEPQSPQRLGSIELDGELLYSRKVGSLLYLVTRHRPQPDGWIARPEQPSELAHNERLITNTPLQELLPHVQVDGQSQPLVEEDGCLLPKSRRANEGYANLVTLSAFDVSTREPVAAVCLNAHVRGLYASESSLYLGTSFGPWEERRTGVHKFSLSEDRLDYQGTGQVPGELNWAEPSFSMDEQDGYLRIVTTERGPNGKIDHQLTVLGPDAQSDGYLKEVATLPNDKRPKAIGKPGEDIFAVRFLGERAYIVTFERIDPLYVLDLSDPQDPRIAGELEIPGFSTYLHPAGDGYLVSVGQAADDEGRAQGVKVELFDVRDMSNPRSLDRHTVGDRGSWSAALHNLHAFNALETEQGQLRFTLPMTVAQDDQASRSGLYLYEVNGLSSGQATLNPVGSLIPDTDENHVYDRAARSRLHDDALFYVEGDRVWSSFWQAPEQANGPF